MFFHQHPEISIFVDPKYFGSVALNLHLKCFPEINHFVFFHLKLC